MKVTGVTKEDGLACAQLIEVVKRARFDNMSSQDAEVLISAKKWLQALAGLMAGDLKSPPPTSPAPAAVEPAPSTGFKVKAMGPIGSAKPSKKKR